MPGYIITIDGPAASGKSTVARLLAQKLGAGFLDTGAMYRTVTLAAMRDEIDLSNENDLLNVMDRHKFIFDIQNGHMIAQIDGYDVTKLIREQDVTSNARYIAAASKVRERLVEIQRQFAAQHEAIVTEGRDQGTVAFPEANVKFFLTAQPAERARRRLIELQEKGNIENLKQLQQAIEKRDKSDIEREVGPLKPAQDAIKIDTTDLDIEQVVDKLFSYAEKIIKRTNK